MPNYANVPGFDLGKLQDETHVNDKYTPDVRLFSQALAATGAAPTSEGLQQVADWISQNGGKASASNDRLSINGGQGIDAIRDVGGQNADWWYNNNPQPQQATTPTPKMNDLSGMLNGSTPSYHLMGAGLNGAGEEEGRFSPLIQQILGRGPNTPSSKQTKDDSILSTLLSSLGATQ